MLILNRREEEVIIINDDIVVKILNAESGRVKIGIHAPKHVTVHREEVYNRIKGEKKKKKV